MITTVLFDLDGTLLPMDNDEFTKYYFKFLCEKLAPYGFDSEELIQAIWTGTAAMVKNDGSQTNESAFWKRFAAVLGDRVNTYRPVFEDFYRNEFNSAMNVCGKNQALIDLIHDLKERSYRIALATNPIFPAIATENRIRWAGLEPSDFELYTTYENIGYTKPNPAYYREILNRMQVRADETVMVGNDATEDMAAQDVGMQVFLLTDCLLNRANKDISVYPHGDATALRTFLLG